MPKRAALYTNCTAKANSGCLVWQTKHFSLKSLSLGRTSWRGRMGCGGLVSHHREIIKKESKLYRPNWVARISLISVRSKQNESSSS